MINFIYKFIVDIFTGIGEPVGYAEEFVTKNPNFTMKININIAV
jgi:hypothetical protein